jgi:hypothetical protein
MRVLIAAVLMFTACAPMARPAPSVESQIVSSAPSVTASIAPTATATPVPTPVSPATTQLDPTVTIASTPFPIAPTFALTRAAVAPADEDTARLGITRYLEGLDRYRDFGDFLPARGVFGEAVAAALVASRTPGVKRTFVLESMRIEALYKKPWGTQALADVRVTIADRAVDRSAPDQRESGLLRMVGDDRRFSVADAWDDSNGQWFNGRASDNVEGMRFAVAQAVGTHLRTESWVVGLPAQTFYDDVGATPFQNARRAYVATFDRAMTPSRTFVDLTGAIERYDTFAEIPDGMATVRVIGTLVTIDAAGRTQHELISRNLKVFFGSWAPEVVDEEVASGVWRSGGDLALVAIDVNRA